MTARITSLTLAGLALGAATAFADGPRPLELERVVVRHPDINNMVAGVFYMPRGWKWQGRIQGYPMAYHQATLEGTVSDPDSLDQIEALPWAPCVWHTAQFFPTPRMAFDRGGLFKLEPMSPRELVEKVSLPLVRKGTGARVISHDELPDLARAFAKLVGPTTKIVAGRTRVAYLVGGKPVEEDFYLILYYTTANIGAGVSTFWGPVVPPFALRSAAGKLDEAAPRLLAIRHSFTINPKWAEEVAKVQALFAWRVTNQTLNTAELSRNIAANNEAIRGMIRQSYENRDRITDRTARNFDDYIRGVQEFTAGGESYVLPNTRRFAWVNGLGDVIMSDDANFDPNLRGRGSWTPLKPMR